MPLAGTTRDDCVVKLPVSARWELADMLPTGRRLELPDAAEYQRGRKFGELKLDDVFSGLLPGDAGDYEASIRDPAGCLLRIRFGQPFRECVVYTPLHREAICIEPYTCVAGAFAEHMRGIDAGVRIIPPGESFQAAVRYAIDPSG
jgi:aldose 1-epimerase